MIHPATLPGFVATRGVVVTPHVGATRNAVKEAHGLVKLLHWGLPAGGPQHEGVTALTLSRVVRSCRGAVGPGRVTELMHDDPIALTQLLPPFGAVAGEPEGVRTVADSMGFQPIFHTAPSPSGPAVLSTSALIAGRAARAALDETALGVQSLLGWQLGQRTLFEGVSKLSPGGMATLDDAGISIVDARDEPLEPLELDVAVKDAAALLRTSLCSLLDEHPDAVLQLTGGMDSRLLLSAIPPARRRGLHAMTLHVPGSGDADCAREIAARFGVLHDVREIAQSPDVSPEEAWELCIADAVRLDGMSDPVALAAQRIAERAFDQGIRISGLGGEVARGFYYVGPVRPRRFTRRDAARLASWRMVVNESVEPGLLDVAFRRWAWEATIDSLHGALRRGGDEWFAATDDLYLRHRMQRWAGATDAAVADQRTVINPMLDPDFIRIARRLAPAAKANARFLARLQMELDPKLGSMRLEGRPAPRAFAERSIRGVTARLASRGDRLTRKASQRLRRANRPPAGGAVLSELVVRHWRANPRILDDPELTRWVDPEWLGGVVHGAVDPRPSSVAFITNVLTTTGG
jgi:asparagine synthase (glutamine-hydrolysing)